MKGMTIAGVILSALALILILISMFAPGWFNYFGIKDGLFYSCNALTGCAVYPTSKSDTSLFNRAF